ncbi:MAG: hypothetical protein WD604_10360 [Balneolaceae bacterium]
MKLNSLKHRIFFFPLLAAFFITACEGPAGPEGPPGPEVIPVSFEFEADLLQDNDFEFFREIPGQIEVFGSDVMLAYVLEDYIEEDDLEVWRQLPLTDFTENGTRVMSFDHTVTDIRVFLDADYALGQADEFEDLLIRAVHVPAGLVSENNMQKVQQAASVRELESVLGTKIRQVD